MRNIKIILTILVFIITTLSAHAIEFKLLVLPTTIFSACDNYFCFPEVSNIMAQDTIKNFYKYKNIKTSDLAQVRAILEQNPTLKSKTQSVLNQYAANDKIDFTTLKEIANAFDVKSVLLINSYATNDKMNSRKNLWDILEISSAFQITYPYVLKTNVVLTDCVNNLIMWSGKYSKEVSNSDGYYSATNQTQAMSQLEKVQLYSRDNISQNISQNVFMRFFPRDVRTINIAKPKTEEPQTKFIPNALEHLSDPHIKKQFETGSGLDFSDSSEEFIYEF